ncbi:MAG: cation:proton antiporter [Pseudomonadota bacterium]
MDFSLWCVFAGILLVFMALSATLLKRLPLSTSIVYLLVGAALSPWWLDALRPNLSDHVTLIEHATEIVVLVSLFTSGLKLSAPVADRRWTLPLRLASVSMVVTVAAVALVAWGLMGMPLGAAVLLGAILAPTDPVLASDVQVAHPGDQDELKFALTGEGGLNDGTAFPFVMLGLGLLGQHEIGAWGWRWFAVDVLWAGAAGLAVGAAVGALIGALVIYLRKVHKEAVGLDNFIALGIIALSYGLAVELTAYGFLSVFSAGFAFRRLERWHTAKSQGTPHRDSAPGKDRGKAADLVASGSDDEDPAEALLEEGSPRTLATHQEKAGAFMAHQVLTFNEQIERIGEVTAVVVVGALLSTVDWSLVPWFFVGLLFVVIRPVAVFIGLVGSTATTERRAYIGWLGIRGIGSIYYLAYAINHGLAPSLADQFTAITLAVVVTSVAVHGLSVTPLMNLYAGKRREDRSGSRR